MFLKSKIMVFQLKEVIYTILFLLLGILLVSLLVIMFCPKESSPSDRPASVEESSYIPGVYTSSVLINYTPVEVQVTVDSNRINEIRLVNLSDTVTVMSPLLAPTIEDLEKQIVSKQSLTDLTYTQGMEYTYQVLVQGIARTLEKAKLPENEE